MSSGLVDVDVEAHEEVEALKGLRHPRAVRRRQHCVRPHHHKRADLAIARRFDLFGQAGKRELAHDLRSTRYPGSVSSSRDPRTLPRGPGGVTSERWWGCEHRAARLVEVSGQDVDHIDQPTCEGSVLLQTSSEPPINHSTFRCRQFVSERLDLLGTDPASLRRLLGSEGRHRLPER